MGPRKRESTFGKRHAEFCTSPSTSRLGIGKRGFDATVSMRGRRFDPAVVGVGLEGEGVIHEEE